MADRIKGLPQNKFFSLDSAKKWARNYRKWAKKQGKKDPVGQVQAFGFNKDVLLKVLNQEGAAGIRIYMGLDEDGPKSKQQGRPMENVFIVAVDENNNNILESKSRSTQSIPEEETGDLDISPNQALILQDSFLCPPFCGDDPIGGG